MYLLVVNYETDAERKRIDYAIERWKGKLNVWKPKGAIIIVDGEKVDDFIEDICSRLEIEEFVQNKMEVYLIKKYTPEISKKTKRLTYETNESVGVVEKFLKYLMAKLNANYEYSNASKVYSVYTKKGHAKVETRIDGGEITKITVVVEGFGGVVDFVAKKIDDEIKAFLG